MTAQMPVLVIAEDLNAFNEAQNQTARRCVFVSRPEIVDAYPKGTEYTFHGRWYIRGDANRISARLNSKKFKFIQL